MAAEWPDPCPKCHAEAVLRKFCEGCGEGVYVIQHSEHYMGGAQEVIPCKCSQAAPRRENRHLWTQGKPKPKEKKKKKPAPTVEELREKYARNPTWVSTPEMARKAAENLAKGMKIAPAMREAGYSRGKAQQGEKGLNRMIRAELKSLGRKYVEAGRDLSPEEQEALVRGRLWENVILGRDKGVMSAKQLGADKRVSMWQPDSQVGMVVLQPPVIPEVKHEVPWIKSKFQEEKELEEKNQGQQPEPEGVEKTS